MHNYWDLRPAPCGSCQLICIFCFFKHLDSLSLFLALHIQMELSFGFGVMILDTISIGVVLNYILVDNLRVHARCKMPLYVHKKRGKQKIIDCASNPTVLKFTRVVKRTVYTLHHQTPQSLNTT